MNKDDIKRAIGKIESSNEMKGEIFSKISNRHHSKFVLRPIISISAVAITIAIVIAAALITNVGFPNGNLKNRPTDKIAVSDEGIILPKLELPKKTNSMVAMDMIGLIVYKGRIYTQTSTSINPEKATGILGKKIGRTKGNINEWSKQDEYAVDFASTTGIQDVYTVKGYDENFRIMTYEKIDGTVYAQFYECLNGITVNSGKDVFDKLKLINNVKASKYEQFDSWNNNKQQYKTFDKIDVLKEFINDLSNTVPYSQQSLSYLFDNDTNADQKFIYLILNDGSEVQLRLFKEGYIFYGGAHIFFKMDSSAFKSLWSALP